MTTEEQLNICANFDDGWAFENLKEGPRSVDGVRHIIVHPIGFRICYSKKHSNNNWNESLYVSFGDYSVPIHRKLEYKLIARIEKMLHHEQVIEWIEKAQRSSSANS